MNSLKNYFLTLLTLTLGFIPFIPSFGSIDMIAPQYLYLSITQVIILFSLLIFKEKKINLNTLDYLFISFLLITILSFVKSDNIEESIIAWSRYLTLFLTYFNLKILFNIVDSKKILLLIMLSLLIIESLVVFYVFVLNYSFDTGLDRIRELQGLSSNQNIGAFSILIKIPFLLYGFYRFKKKLFRGIMILFLLISMFCILIISSRAAIIGLFLILIYLIISSRFRSSLITPKKSILIPLFIFSLGTTFLVQNLMYSNSNKTSSLTRITNYNDESTNDRINYYKNAIHLFIDNPLLGIGLGNWKIKSLETYNSKVTNYKVPFHAHNDFLQIASETGLFGFILFFLILFYPVYFLIKNYFFKAKAPDDLGIFLLLALLIFIWDSNINFPRLRPYSQMNLIYILSFFSSTYLDKNQNKNFSFKSISILALIILIPINYLNIRVLNSYKEIYYMYYDFNMNGIDLEASVDDIKDYEDFLPNITNTTIPIKLSKANYYLQEGKFQEAKKLISQGKKVNPHLGFGDFLLAKIYYEEQKKDSAFYFIEKAINKVPKNVAHVVLYQTLLVERKEFKKESEIFEITKDLKHPLIWSNHFFALTKNKIEFNNSDKENIKLAMTLFPENKLFQSFDLIISKGVESSILAAQFDGIASENFKNKEYNKAIDNWKKAAAIVPNEDSYYLNIALTYCYMKEFQKAVEVLKEIESLDIKSNDGFFEFIGGFAFYELGQKDLGCKYIRASNNLGYKAALNFLKKISCKT